MDKDNVKQHTILAVDDEPLNIDMLLAILKDYDVIPALSGEDALGVAKTEPIDLLLLDVVMPDIDGFEVCRRLKADEATRDIPVIFITSKTDEDSIEEAYLLGGIDYVTKPFRPRELLARVRTQFELLNLIRRLDFLATHDSLTGIYNRRKFFELGQKLFSRTTEELYVMMMDIDHFKCINDIHGHGAGDLILRQTSKIVAANIPKGAIFGRLGGEEFGVLFTSPSEDEAESLVENVLTSVAGQSVEVEGEKKLSCTISNGLARKRTDTLSLDYLLKEADNALYEAKEGGRNRSIFRRNRRSAAEIEAE